MRWMLFGFAHLPPKGGLPSIMFEHIMACRDCADDFDALKKQHHTWPEEHQDKNILTEQMESQGGGLMGSLGAQAGNQEGTDGGMSPSGG